MLYKLILIIIVFIQFINKLSFLFLEQTYPLSSNRQSMNFPYLNLVEPTIVFETESNKPLYIINI